MQPILKIDLSTNAIESIKVPADWESDYLGGASLAARLLFDSLTVDLDPLSPAAPLLMMTGPLTGTAAPTVGRFVVCGKSPATGLWGESNCGGFWGPELRMAGWDGILITGKAHQPVFVVIEDDKIEIKDGSSVWGEDTYRLQELISKELALSGARILGIGPAGEALIPFALMLCDHGRVAGRTGMGAVMGSKNLKAIAVKGSRKIPVANPTAFASIRSETNRSLKANSMTRVLHELGTAGAADYFDYLGEMPKKYFTAGILENSNLISGSSVAETILTGKTACHACVIACGRVVTLDDGQKRKGPEYETLAGFGVNLGITDTHAITRLGELCDRYGLDSISTSGVIGLAFRLFEMGLINHKDTDGLTLKWGNSQAASQLIGQIVRREGLGMLLANGALALATLYGVPEEAMQVNNLEMPYHDPRGASGMAIVYASSPRGACHNQSDYFLVELGQIESGIGMEFFDRFSGPEKAGNVAIHQDWRTLNNSLVMCIFGAVPPEDLARLISYACGRELDVAGMQLCGERAWNLKRMINSKLGLTKKKDKLPEAILRPLAEGGSAGYVPDFTHMMDTYYTARGWDPVTGMPTTVKLDSLGLGWISKISEKINGESQ